MVGVWKGKRRDSFGQSPLCIFILLFTSVWLHCPIFSFATSKQEPLNRVRERSGRALHTSAPRLSKLNGQERSLLGTISKAGKQRRWPSVESSIANYSGTAVPIYTAAMHAAVECGRYNEGADIYQKCRRCCQEFDAPVFAEALHIFRKLKQPTQVRKIWNETLRFCNLNGILALARITAAADEGDVEAASVGLDAQQFAVAGDGAKTAAKLQSISSICLADLTYCQMSFRSQTCSGPTLPRGFEGHSSGICGNEGIASSTRHCFR